MKVIYPDAFKGNFMPRVEHTNVSAKGYHTQNIDCLEDALLKAETPLAELFLEFAAEHYRIFKRYHAGDMKAVHAVTELATNFAFRAMDIAEEFYD